MTTHSAPPGHPAASSTFPRLQERAVRRLFLDEDAATSTVSLLTDLRRRILPGLSPFAQEKLDGTLIRRKTGVCGQYRNWRVSIDPAIRPGSWGFPPHDPLQAVFAHEYVHAVDEAFTLDHPEICTLFRDADSQINTLRNTLQPVVDVLQSGPFIRWQYMSAGYRPRRGGLIGLDGGSVRIHGQEHLSVLTEYALYFPEWLSAVKAHLGADYLTPLLTFWGGTLSVERPEIRAGLDRTFRQAGVSASLIHAEVRRQNPGMRRPLKLPETDPNPGDAL